MFLQFTFFRITIITDRAVVQSFLYMNWFSMLFQIDFFRRIIVTTLACFVTCCPHENDWHVFHKYLFQKNLNHNLSNYFWMNKVKMLIHSTFLRITMITDRVVTESFLYMNWFSMVFQIYSFRKIIVKTLACFLVSCDILSSCLSKKSILEKLNSQIEQLFLNEQNQDAFPFHFFENNHDHILSCCWIFSCPHENN